MISAEHTPRSECNTRLGHTPRPEHTPHGQGAFYLRGGPGPGLSIIDLYKIAQFRVVAYLAGAIGWSNYSRTPHQLGHGKSLHVHVHEIELGETAIMARARVNSTSSDQGLIELDHHKLVLLSAPDAISVDQFWMLGSAQGLLELSPLLTFSSPQRSALSPRHQHQHSPCWH